MPKQWQFVFTSGSGGVVADKETKREIRRNAMRHFRACERQSTLKQHNARERSTESPSLMHASLTRHGPNAIATFLPEMEGGWMDPRGMEGFSGPFSYTALPPHKDAYRLFHFFINALLTRLIFPFGSTCGPELCNTEFIECLLQDEGALLSVLFHCSRYHDHLAGEGSWSRSTTKYHVRAIETLKKRLSSHDENERVGDGVVFMVGCLGATGNIDGSTQPDAPHRNALATLISLRGGLDTLGWGGALATIIRIEDLVRATISSQHPRVPPPDLSENPLAPSLLYPLYYEKDATFESKMSSDSPLDTFFEIARNLSTYQDSLRRCPSESSAGFNERVTNFSQVCIFFQHRLLSLDIPSPYIPLNVTHETRDELRMGPEICKEVLYRGAYIILKLYTIVVFRNFASHFNTVRTLQKQFQPIFKAFRSAPMGEISKKDKSLLLWTLWVAACTMQPLPTMDEDEYVTLAEPLFCDLEINDWSEARLILSGILWSVRLQNERCLDLCARVGLVV